MEVRRATAGDATAIATVHVRTWQEAYPGLIPQDYLDGLSVDERATTWVSTLAATHWPRRVTFVLEDAGSVVGFALVRRSEDDDLGDVPVGEVAALYVRASAWGAGGGRALLEAARSELAVAGYEYATLWVLGTNARARRFYQRCGWQADGATRLHDWEAFSVEDVRYRATLDPPPGEAG